MFIMADNHHTPWTVTLTIDARGLACPLPVLRLRKALNAQASGAVVELLATDRAAVRDVPVFCAGHGHQLLAAHQDKNSLRFVVRRA